MGRGVHVVHVDMRNDSRYYSEDSADSSLCSRKKGARRHQLPAKKAEPRRKYTILYMKIFFQQKYKTSSARATDQHTIQKYPRNVAFGILVNDRKSDLDFHETEKTTLPYLLLVAILLEIQSHGFNSMTIQQLE